MLDRPVMLVLTTVRREYRPATANRYVIGECRSAHHLTSRWVAPLDSKCQRSSSLDLNSIALKIMKAQNQKNAGKTSLPTVKITEIFSFAWVPPEFYVCRVLSLEITIFSRLWQE